MSKPRAPLTHGQSTTYLLASAEKNSTDVGGGTGPWSQGGLYCLWLAAVSGMALALRLVGVLPGWTVPELAWHGIGIAMALALFAGLRQKKYRNLVQGGLVLWHGTIIFRLSFPHDAEVQQLLTPAPGPLPVAALQQELAWVSLLILLFPVLVRLPLWIHIATALLASQAFLLAMGIRSAAGWNIPASDFIQRTEVHLTFVALAAVALAVLLEEQRRRLASLQEQVADLGSYQLGVELGQGGMGSVHRATHGLLKREVAVKIVRSDKGTSQARERLQREALAAAQLHSPHTVRVYDCGVAPDHGFFVVMELLRGVDLEDLVLQRGKQPAGRVIAWMRQACMALQEAHALGLVHRDIKPANLFNAELAGRFDHLKVLDFGLVWAQPASELAAAKRLTTPGFTNGTPEYMAPEQAQGKDVDGRADLYALGCVGWWLLTGQCVFERPSKMDTLLAQVHDDPPRLQSIEPTVPEALAAIIHSCLQKNPADRPAMAADLEVALAAVAGPEWTQDAAARMPDNRALADASAL